MTRNSRLLERELVDCIARSVRDHQEVLKISGRHYLGRRILDGFHYHLDITELAEQLDADGVRATCVSAIEAVV